VLHREGLDGLCRAPARALSFRDVDWGLLGRSAGPGAQPRPRDLGGGWSGNTSTCPTPTSRSPRRSGRPASATAPRVEADLGGPVTTAARRRARRRHSGQVRRRRHPRRFSASGGSRARSAPIRYARGEPDPAARTLPRPAVHDDRGGPQPRRDRGRPTPRSFADEVTDPIISTMADQEEDRRGQGPTSVGRCGLGRLPGEARPRFARRGGLRARPRSPNGTGTATRSTNSYRERADRRRAADLGHLAGRPPW